MGKFWQKYWPDVTLFIVIAVVLFIAMIILKSKYSNQAGYYRFGYPPVRQAPGTLSPAASPEYTAANAVVPKVTQADIPPDNAGRQNLITDSNVHQLKMAFRDTSIQNKEQYKAALDQWNSASPQEKRILQSRPYDSIQECNKDNGVTKSS